MNMSYSEPELELAPVEFARFKSVSAAHKVSASASPTNLAALHDISASPLPHMKLETVISALLAAQKPRSRECRRLDFGVVSGCGS